MSVSSITGGNTPEDTAYQRASRAEREVKDRIDAAERTVRAAEQQASDSLERIKDQYESRYQSERSRQEAALEAQKLKNYENLRDLQRNQHQEKSRIQQDGNYEIDKIQEHYRHQGQITHRREEEKLQKLLKQSQSRLNYEERQAKEALQGLQSQNHQEFELTRDQYEEQLQRMKKAYQQEVDRLRLQTRESTEAMRKAYQKSYVDEHQKSQKALTTLQQSATEQLNTLQTQRSQQLSAYEDRQKDPFYQLVRLPTQLEESADFFELRVKIPDSEEPHLSAIVRGNDLMISGHRRNKETIQDERGHTIGTSSYQTFHEIIPLPKPIDGRKITREFKENELIVKIPKTQIQQQKNHSSQRSTLNSLNQTQTHTHSSTFPANLVVTVQEPEFFEEDLIP